MNKQSKWISIICAMMIGVLFCLAVTAVLLVSGMLSFSKINLTFTTDSAEALYDGVPLTNHHWRLASGSLKKGHELEVMSNGEQTNVGESKNTISVKITDELGADVTSDYAINYRLGTLKVNPRTLVITSHSAIKDYDGQPLSLAEYEISPDCDGLVSGHRVSVIVTGYIIEPGSTSNTIDSVSVYDELGKDVTSNYRLILREGMLVVEGSVDGSGGGGSGEGGSGEGGSGEGGSGEGGSGEDGSGGGGSAGDEPGGDEPGGDEPGDMLPDGDLLDQKADDTVLFSVYSEMDDYIYLRMQSYGDYNGKGWEDISAYDKLISGQYPAIYLTTYSLTSDLNQPYALNIKSHCGVYALPYYLIPGSGNYVGSADDVRCDGAPEDIYSVEYYRYSDAHKIKLPYEIQLFEQNYRDFVYAQYTNIDQESLTYMQDLIAQLGLDRNDPAVIAKVAAYIQGAAKYNLKYDKAMDKEENIAISFLDTYKEGVCRHYASAATLMFRALGIPARYTVGVAAQTQAGMWSNITSKQAHAWVEVYVDGEGWVMVEVTGSSDSDGGLGDSEHQKSVTLTPKTQRYLYDGLTHSMLDINNPELSGFQKYEQLGYTYTAVVSGEASTPGKTSTVIEAIRIYDPDKKDVTDQFNIKLNKGVLHIYLEEFRFESLGCEMVYRGSAPDLIVNYDHEIDTHLNVQLTSTAESCVGQHLNSFTVKLTDGDGNNVTDQYLINYIYGSVTITPYEIAFKASDATKVYDGTPLTSSEYIIAEGSLVDGHIVGLCQISGEQIEIGRSDNIITQIMIFDENGKDVTSNYQIKLLAGKLKVNFK